MRFTSYPSPPTKKENPQRPRRSERRLGIKRPPKPSRFAKFAPLWSKYAGRIVASGLLTLAIWIILLLVYDSAFYVQMAVIEGNYVIDDHEIYAVSDIDNYSIFRLNPHDIATNIENLPNVKEAIVSLTLPANVHIHVIEREPDIIWRTNEQVWWIDDEGVFVPPRIAQRDKAVQEKHLTIIDVDNQPVHSNEKADLSMIRAAQKIRLYRPELKEIFYTKSYGLFMFSPEGWTIYLGDEEKMQAKLVYAEVARNDLLQRGVEPIFIDVRNPSRIVYQEKEPEEDVQF